MTDPLQERLQLSLPHLLGNGRQGLGVLQDLLGFNVFDRTARQPSDNRLELHQLLAGDVLTLRDTRKAR